MDQSIQPTTTINQPSPANIRRAKAAKQYLLHAFPNIHNNNNKSNYYTTVHIAHVNGGTHSSYRNATAWPIQMQGPLHITTQQQQPQEEIPKPWNETAVVAMEVQSYKNNTSGIVLARANHSLEYLLICRFVAKRLMQ